MSSEHDAVADVAHRARARARRRPARARTRRPTNATIRGRRDARCRSARQSDGAQNPSAVEREDRHQVDAAKQQVEHREHERGLGDDRREATSSLELRAGRGPARARSRRRRGRSSRPGPRPAIAASSDGRSGSWPRLVGAAEEQQRDDAAVEAAPAGDGAVGHLVHDDRAGRTAARSPPAATQRMSDRPPGMQHLELAADPERHDRDDHDPADVDAHLEAEDPRDRDAVGEQAEHRQVGRDRCAAGQAQPRHRPAPRGAARTPRPAARSRAARPRARSTSPTRTSSGTAGRGARRAGRTSTSRPGTTAGGRARTQRRRTARRATPADRTTAARSSAPPPTACQTHARGRAARAVRHRQHRRPRAIAGNAKPRSRPRERRPCGRCSRSLRTGCAVRPRPRTCPGRRRTRRGSRSSPCAPVGRVARAAPRTPVRSCSKPTQTGLRKTTTGTATITTAVATPTRIEATPASRAALTRPS